MRETHKRKEISFFKYNSRYTSENNQVYKALKIKIVNSWYTSGIWKFKCIRHLNKIRIVLFTHLRETHKRKEISFFKYVLWVFHNWVNRTILILFKCLVHLIILASISWIILEERDFFPFVSLSQVGFCLSALYTWIFIFTILILSALYTWLFSLVYHEVYLKKEISFRLWVSRKWVFV